MKRLWFAFTSSFQSDFAELKKNFSAANGVYSGEWEAVCELYIHREQQRQQQQAGKTSSAVHNHLYRVSFSYNPATIFLVNDGLLVVHFGCHVLCSCSLPLLIL